MTTLVLRESLSEEVLQAASQEGIDAAEFLAEAVRYRLAAFRQKRIAAETEAWYQLPVMERRQYDGQYVAVLNGAVIDHDADRMQLYFRVREKFGRQPILITPGGDQPMPVYRVRSPKRA
jgi:hypothetical protein